MGMEGKIGSFKPDPYADLGAEYDSQVGETTIEDEDPEIKEDMAINTVDEYGNLIENKNNEEDGEDDKETPDMLN
jgi:hypothetical protein